MECRSHSAFFSTTLDLLLRYLRARTLVLGGLTGDRCVLASDAYLRDFRMVVPSAGVLRSIAPPIVVRSHGCARCSAPTCGRRAP